MTARSHHAPAGVAALASTEAVLRVEGRSFDWARRLLGARHACNATRLYGFCRLVDDIADGEPRSPTAEDRLRGIASAIASGETDDPAVIDALALMLECRIEPSIVMELIRGIASDLVRVRMGDEAELLRYCYRVAGTVGLMMCKALDVTDARASPHAVDLNIGMQLTNICRDVNRLSIFCRPKHSYDSDGYRAALEDKGITPCIPPRKTRKVQHAYDRTLYKLRHRVENMFGRLKDWRRVATRYDRCAHTFMSAIVIAATVIFWL